jgi:hypothetical protein
VLSEDEEASSDEEEEEGGLDDYEAMPPEELAAMAAELAEKGEGHEELADAHTRWMEEQDDAALKELQRCVKYGFSKGRRRLGQVRPVELCRSTKVSRFMLHNPEPKANLSH